MMSRKSYLETGVGEDCTGCAACGYACPTGAIEMVEDACGFEYPQIDESKCIHCDKCLRSCHMNYSEGLKGRRPIACYGAIDKDASSLRNSASGGVATALSRRAVDAGGVVYGCVADREDVHHERLIDGGSLRRAQGSKYVQSDLTRVFAPMETDLKTGMNVLFVGSPCQCAAVRQLFGHFDGLRTVDLVCEGVPSRRMYSDFLEDLENAHGESVGDFRFRDKCGGWSTKNAVVLGGDGVPLKRQYHSHRYYYYHLFSKALILRASCYSCPYACAERTSDVTVGDLWGAETAGLGYGLSELDGGVSCALANTETGLEALEDAGLDLRDCTLDTIARSNSCLVKPSVCDFNIRRSVMAAYANGGAAGMKREYESLFTRGARLKAEVAANIPLSLRVVLKRMKALFKRN